MKIIKTDRCNHILHGIFGFIGEWSGSFDWTVVHHVIGTGRGFLVPQTPAHYHL